VALFLLTPTTAFLGIVWLNSHKLQFITVFALYKKKNIKQLYFFCDSLQVGFYVADIMYHYHYCL